ncbi:hypothetical protein GCM10007386_09170 [Pseudoduganella dura]|nr:hypothetical protein GCM10007386_09170 [Pseudoduganella dura]
MISRSFASSKALIFGGGNPTAELAIGEAECGEKCTRQTQDLVRLAQLTIFSLERLDALFFSIGRAVTLTSVTFPLPHSAP